MATVGVESSPSVPCLPTETLAHIASFLTPSLTRGWLPGSRGKQYEQWKEQHKIITSLQLADRRFAAASPPYVAHSSGARFASRRRIFVIELRWEIGDWTYTDMSPLFLPFLINLTSLAVLQEDEGGYGYPLKVPQSLVRSISSLSNLVSLQLDEYNAFDDSLDINAELPALRRLALGSWWDHQFWGSKLERIVDLHYIEDWEFPWEQPDDLAILHYLPRLQHLTLDSHLSTRPLRGEARPRVVRKFSVFLAETMYDLYPLEVRSELPLQTLTVTKLELFRAVELVDFLQTLASCAALRSLTFTECSSEKADDATPWSALLMDHVDKLTIKFNAHPSSPLPLETLLGSFPNLTHLDISNGIVRQDFLAPLDTLDGLSLELRTILEAAHEACLAARFEMDNNSDT
ncbi:hypothetical protein BCR35DRAFT_332392 [Leucosporidium creatinivorum]|uniref:Uncharacterized protein n=1 Tax=Leucosporidium creatinivorum TaxID=106004 RepID=A0A1Y2F2B2_9BASI|nr:hypothetical protein BCR35DRAFT_332392 [Leucosporidium creatinivorum]